MYPKPVSPLPLNKSKKRKEEWLIQQEKEELATLTNLMLPTQAIKLVFSYCPYLTLTTGSRFDKRKDSDKEKALTWRKDLTFLPLPEDYKFP